jgi:hypothetical protein
MKIFLSIIFLSTSIYANSKASQKTQSVKPKTQNSKQESVKNDKLKVLDKKEDCDTKAKKIVEIKPESISLGGNTGCSLDQAH